MLQALKSIIAEWVTNSTGELMDESKVTINQTPDNFEGDYTVVVFPFTRAFKKKPDEIAESLGIYLLETQLDIASFNVVKGFLNITYTSNRWLQAFQDIYASDSIGRLAPNNQKVLVEFSSPNTNKPLHLGHVRNILLGWSVSQILDAVGFTVIKTQVINDRGISISKSMWGWLQFADGATPASTGMKGDHFVGDYYVKFNEAINKEYAFWQPTEAAQKEFAARPNEDMDAPTFFKSYIDIYFNKYSEIGRQTRELLVKWEANDPDTRQLWMTMNGWVYEGFKKTFQDLGVAFDIVYYESEVYLIGKEIIEKGLTDGVFFRKDDGSVWIDLTDKKLDEKPVLRGDGTSLYITQDIGLANQRFMEYQMDRVVYVVGNEQEYHFNVLFETLKKLGAPYAEQLYHLSYGMVDLPSGKMKSREGTVVDADDLIEEVIQEAATNSSDRAESEGYSQALMDDINTKVGLASLKYFILKVHPKKRMVFNPKESVDLHGNTGPYIQYAAVRIKGLLRRATTDNIPFEATSYTDLQPVERDIIKLMTTYNETLLAAADALDPSMVASFLYDLAKLYNRLWHDLSIFGADTEARGFRLQLSEQTGEILEQGLSLLGIDVPERM